jgi:AcrR family transcriptional regulator
MMIKVGLRERKKRAAMRHIQRVALDLFDTRGYANVTVEQIAEAAEFSPSTVYRYFGTKEGVVLREEIELQSLVAAVESELVAHPPVEAVRRALLATMAEYFDRDEDLTTRRTHYALEEPALRAAMLEQTDEFVRRVAEALARASGREADDLHVQVIAAALMWSLIAAIRHWHADGYRRSLREELDKALAVVEGGLRLD